MAIQRWDPFSELANLQSQMSRLFGESLQRTEHEDGHGRLLMPAVDVRETDDAIVIEAELPGVDKQDIDVRIEGARLTLKAEKRGFSEQESGSYQRVERTYGMFARSFTLPEAIDAEQMTARYTDGVLVVTVPKKPETKPRSVKVQ